MKRAKKKGSKTTPDPELELDAAPEGEEPDVPDLGDDEEDKPRRGRPPGSKNKKGGKKGKTKISFKISEQLGDEVLTSLAKAPIVLAQVIAGKRGVMLAFDPSVEQDLALIAKAGRELLNSIEIELTPGLAILGLYGIIASKAVVLRPDQVPQKNGRDAAPPPEATPETVDAPGSRAVESN